MEFQPKIQPRADERVEKRCPRCGRTLRLNLYIRVSSKFFPDRHTPICADCLEKELQAADYSWSKVDKLCQWINIPFVPNEFEKIRKTNNINPFYVYSQMFLEEEYKGLEWDEYFQKFQELRAAHQIDNELPEIREARLQKLQGKWGENYDLDELEYLEGLYDGLLQSQNINGALQIDQAKKICKISLELDSRIRAGTDFDKILSSYDKLVKVAEFTPKNAKNASDFESIGELCRWLERRGWVNKYYDNVTRDVVDETIKNIQAYFRRLYTNESGIGDEITKRIEALQSAPQENIYADYDEEFDLDKYEVEGFDDLESGDFNTGGDFDIGI